MSLQPAEKAAFTLWLCAGRHLDLNCCSCEDPTGTSLVAAARGEVEGAAAGAELSVTSYAAVGPYLVAEADRLAQLLRGAAGATSAAQVGAAEIFLRAEAEKMRQDDTGDGQAIGDAPCSCSVFNLIAEVEMRVRTLLKADGLTFGINDLTVKYTTALTNDGSEFAPFCIGSKAFIKRSPRMVQMIVLAKPLTSRDLWHIAYSLHHELVCHAFQDVPSTGPRSDAHQNCHWSEGWMDTLGFDLVTEWTEAPRDWLQMWGEEAKGALREFHDHRYDKPAKLIDTDIKHRRLARQAYRRLVKTLKDYKIAISADEAHDIARRFSLVANSQASCKRLKPLGTKLRTLLLNDVRPEAGVAAATACLAFTADRNLDKLEQTLEQIGAI